MKSDETVSEEYRDRLITFYQNYSERFWMRTLGLILLPMHPLSGLHADNIPKYKRSYFGVWADSDGDCQNTRHELLQELSTSIMSFTDNTCEC